MTVLRRALAPVLLGLLAAGAAVAGLRSADLDASAGLAASPTAAVEHRLATPVLSPRRVPVLLALPAAEAELVEGLRRVVAASPAATCLIVETAGRRVLEHQPGRPLIPASAMKLAVATAVLDRLGPEARLVTRAVAPAVDGGVVQGPLYLVGGGDPLVATPAYAASHERQPQVFTSLEVLADAVVDAGVREVRGPVVGDESRYDQLRYVPTWRPGYIANHASGPLSALSVDDGFAAHAPRRVAAAEPARHAAAVFVELLRARGVTIAGEAAAGSAPADAAPVAEMPSYPMREIVAQMLRESDNLTAELLVKELGARFGDGGSTAAGTQVVRDTLAAMGIPVDGSVFVDVLRARGVTIAGEAAAGSAPADAAPVAEMPSYPMREIVAQMLRESDNLTAELLVKELGARFGDGGSTAAGTRVVRDTLAAMGIPVDGSVFVDGSGLDRSNRLTCDLLHRTLVRDAGGGALGDGLAVAGRSGTLADRFVEDPLAGRLRAKTGSISGVAALAGEVTSTEGVAFRFAYVMNGVASAERGMALQGQLVDLLVRHPDVARLAGLGPQAAGGGGGGAGGPEERR